MHYLQACLLFFPAGCCATVQRQTSVLAGEGRTEPPNIPAMRWRGQQCLCLLAGCSQAAPRAASKAAPQTCSAEHPGQDATLPRLSRSGGERSLKRGTRGAAGRQQQCFASLQRPFVLPTFALTSSNASVSQPITNSDKAVTGGVRHRMKHPPPSTVTARRTATARNLEGIL